MENYRLEGKTFVIDDYDRLPAFSSFLPGLAGVKGIPMWTFYTNRGQGMNSLVLTIKEMPLWSSIQQIQRLKIQQ